MKGTSHAKGLMAELAAEIALLLKGFIVVERRFKTPVGEIDLVARRFRTLAFVEVKRRGSVAEGAEAIHAKNQSRVRNAAALYLQKHPRYNRLIARFDAVIIAPKTWPRHIPGAWE